MELSLLRTPQGFVPATESEAEKTKKFKLGGLITAKVTQLRNPAFHRKWFALAKIAFDIWSERCDTLEYRGERVMPDFDRFRKDLTILCGFYRPVFNIRGEMRLEAESIAFGNMDEERFEKLFSATINTVLEKIIPRAGYTEETLRAVVDEVVRFG